MSFSEKDRKLQSKTGNSFPSPQPNEPLAAAIAAALKAEFGNTPSAHKTVAQLTRSNERAVRNWFEGKNSPSGENLVILMRHSDLVLRTMLSLADRQDLVWRSVWRACDDSLLTPSRRSTDCPSRLTKGYGTTRTTPPICTPLPPRALRRCVRSFHVGSIGSNRHQTPISLELELCRRDLRPSKSG